jgi:hypothetical protein
MRQLYVAYDDRRERYVISCVDNVIIDWDDEHWQNVSWVVGGRTDTDFDRHQSTAVFFYSQTDAEIARQAIMLHEQFIKDATALCGMGWDENERREAGRMGTGANSAPPHSKKNGNGGHACGT